MGMLGGILAITIGLIVGGWVGYSIGTRWHDRRRTLWALAAAAFVGIWVVDLAGYVVGIPEVSTGSLGLMAGLLTGIKYGGFPEVRVWESAKERAAHQRAPQHSDAPAPESTDAP